MTRPRLDFVEPSLARYYPVATVGADATARSMRCRDAIGRIIMSDKGRTVAVLQPGYLPWLGFFNQVRRSDVFVLYDDVQYDKHGWRNRNRIRTQTGAQWLTVPVRHSGRDWPRIRDVEIDGRTPWARKHVASIRQAYARAPFLRDYIDDLEACLQQPWVRLIDLDAAVIELLGGWLGLTTRIEWASRLGIEGERSERLVRICRHFGAATYLSGNAAREYLDVDVFAGHGIAVEWQDFVHPVYPQLHGGFVPYLSALDLVLNCGPDGAALVDGAAREIVTGRLERNQ